jgi:ankyrin repeat protein
MRAAQGAKVDAVDKDKLTPLIEASITGHVDVVKELLKQGASVDAQVANGATALWLAAGKLSMCLVRPHNLYIKYILIYIHI